MIQNLIDDMHSGKPSSRVDAGDEWLKNNLNLHYQWAKIYNSLLIVTCDENDDRTHYRGLTDPASSQHDIKNRIPTIITGAQINYGKYPEGVGVTKKNILQDNRSTTSLP